MCFYGHTWQWYNITKYIYLSGAPTLLEYFHFTLLSTSIPNILEYLYYFTSHLCEDFSNSDSLLQIKQVGCDLQLNFKPAKALEHENAVVG